MYVVYLSCDFVTKMIIIFFWKSSLISGSWFGIVQFLNRNIQACHHICHSGEAVKFKRGHWKPIRFVHLRNLYKRRPGKLYGIADVKIHGTKMQN